jgi:U3 small nucleolar RNA-associated protein 14
MAKTVSLRTGSRGIKGAHSAPKSTVSSSRNASGYQKRLEWQNKRPPTNDPDVYEYSAIRDRRVNIALDVDKDEVRGLGQDSLDGDAANKDMEVLRQKITAAMGEDMGVVDSEDDEDIDSDAAFEGKVMRSVSVLSNSRKRFVL